MRFSILITAALVRGQGRITGTIGSSNSPQREFKKRMETKSHLLIKTFQILSLNKIRFL
tara:strand:- start:54 stop:230 length:177 start_codon:yes stop_codon:yes gene_type:complete